MSLKSKWRQFFLTATGLFSVSVVFLCNWWGSVGFDVGLSSFLEKQMSVSTSVVFNGLPVKSLIFCVKLMCGK